MRLLLTLRYDGTRYHGWQVQPNGVTIQQRMQDAIQAVSGIRSGLTGCSRTDAGVHADMFCCTIDTEKSLSMETWVGALNAHLPPEIAVYDCREVAGDFHPRYSAKGKRYVYRMWNHPARNPFWEGYAWHIRRPLDADKLNQAAQAYIGKHDFLAFCAAGSTVEDTVRTVRSCGVFREGDMVMFHVEADGFLYNMVRIMVGTLLDMVTGRLPVDAIPAIIDSRDRNCAGATAPAHGLYLDKVLY